MTYAGTRPSYDLYMIVRMPAYVILRHLSDLTGRLMNRIKGNMKSLDVGARMSVPLFWRQHASGDFC